MITESNGTYRVEIQHEGKAWRLDVYRPASETSADVERFYHVDGGALRFGHTALAEILGYLGFDPFAWQEKRLLRVPVPSDEYYEDFPAAALDELLPTLQGLGILPLPEWQQRHPELLQLLSADGADDDDDDDDEPAESTSSPASNPPSAPDGAMLGESREEAIVVRELLEQVRASIIEMLNEDNSPPTGKCAVIEVTPSGDLQLSMGPLSTLPPEDACTLRAKALAAAGHLPVIVSHLQLDRTFVTSLTLFRSP